MKKRFSSLFRSIFGISPEPTPEPEALLEIEPGKTGTYEEQRAELFYYKIAKEWINEQPSGDWILDVGSRSTPIVLEGDFARRTMVDMVPFKKKFDGVEQIVGDWMDFPADEKADLVLCLQVLEHLDDKLVAQFAKKVVAAGKRAIISVPYNWEEGSCIYHKQDPVDLEKLVGWVGKEPVKHYIETRDDRDRLIAIFENEPREKPEFVSQPKDEGDYWKKRAGFHYYDVVKEWIRDQGAGKWVIDVGSRSTPIILEGTFDRRTMVDIDPFIETYEDVEQIQSDWMEFPIEEKADLVLCLQVLEHLDDDLVSPFAQRVLKAGRYAIISVPHKWPESACDYHLQDPVDLEKLIRWAGKEPIKHYVETRDKKERLIALFEGESMS